MRDERRRNIAIGVISAITASACAISAAWILVSMVDKRAEYTPNLKDFQDQCIQVAEELDLKPRRPIEKTVILENESAQEGITQLSTLLGFCPTYRLESLCAGAECRSPFQAILKQRSDLPGIQARG